MTSDETFLENLRKQVDDNLTNEQFGVELLSRNIGISRSQLHRKLHAITGQSVSQFIREHRLNLGMALLKEGGLNASEVAYRIGFGSPTYFNKCFNEYFGFPPGEVKNKIAENPNTVGLLMPAKAVSTRSHRRPALLIFVVAGIISILGIFLYSTTKKEPSLSLSAKSIAILPFKNLSEDQRNEYFSEGVMEAIRTHLTQVSDIQVISRTSVEQYRTTNKPAKEIATELGVSTLLEGSIQRSNNAVRVEVRLIDGRSERQVWARTYDRDLSDVFAIQSEIAEQITRELHAKLSPEEKSKLLATDTKNPRAYDFYLKGVYEFRTYTNEGTHRAIDLLSQAVALDSNYARAYAFLAYSHTCLATIFGAEHSALEAMNNGKPFIDKALSLDPELDIGHMLLGFYHVFHSWDTARAAAAYKKAIVNDDPDALAMYCDYLHFIRNHKKALVIAKRLNAKDPYYPNSRMVLSYFFNNEPDKALEFSEARIKIFSNYNTLDAHGFILLQLGHYEDAVVYFNKAIAVEGIRYPRMLGWMGAAYAKSGQRENALKIVDELRTRLSKGDKASIAFFIAVIYAASDDKVEAMKWINTAYNAHDMEMPWLMTEPQFLSLHGDTAFQRIASQVGF